MDDIFYMKEAINEAKLARLEDEVPIGCVIVKDEKIIARSHNYTYKGKSALKHAEILAIDKASKYVGDFRLEDCTMYVTMEPCSMCAGAIINSRIKRLVIGLADVKRASLRFKYKYYRRQKPIALFRCRIWFDERRKPRAFAKFFLKN